MTMRTLELKRIKTIYGVDRIYEHIPSGIQLYVTPRITKDGSWCVSYKGQDIGYGPTLISALTDAINNLRYHGVIEKFDLKAS